MVLHLVVVKKRSPSQALWPILLPAHPLDRAPINDHLAGFGVEGLEYGCALTGFPDLRFYRHTRVEGSGETVAESCESLWLTGEQVLDNRTAGVAVGAQAVHDRLLKAAGSGKVGIHVQRKGVARKPVEQGLVGGGVRQFLKIRFSVRESDRSFGGVFAAETAVQAGKQSDDVGEQFLPVRVISVCLSDHQRAFASPFVIDVGDLSLGGQCATFRRNGVVENQLVLAVEDTGQVDAGIDGHLGKKVKDGGDSKAGNHFELPQLVKAGPHTQSVEDDVFSAVFAGDRSEFLSDCTQIQGHRTFLELT